MRVLDHMHFIGLVTPMRAMFLTFVNLIAVYTLVLAVGVNPTRLENLNGPSVTLLVVAGQSNAISRAPDSDVRLATPVNGIYQLARTGRATEPFVSAYEPLQHWEMTPMGVGFGFAFAKLVRAEEPSKDVVIIPAAKGQTSLSASEWGPIGELTRDLISRVNSVSGRLDVDKCVFLWHQGESEVVRINSTYLSDIVATFDAMRNGAPVLNRCAFLVGGLSDDFMSHYPNYDIETAMKSIPLTTFVSAQGLATMDGIHFTSASQIELGRRFFETYMSLN